MMKYDYKSLMSTKRERISSVSRKSAINEFYSDRSRIIYCSAFRRLQQKAQVFSLEPNASPVYELDSHIHLRYQIWDVQ